MVTDVKTDGEIPHFIAITCLIWKISSYNGLPVLLSVPALSVLRLILGGKLNL